MSRIRRFLCWLGFHEADPRRRDLFAIYHEVGWCLHCGREFYVRYEGRS